MDLYLMQHGEATIEAESPDRPLTDAGRAAVQRVAARARTAGVQVSHCVHSGKLRAEETAQELAIGLGAVAPVAEWIRSLAGHDTLVLVGHLPFVDRLASLLVAGKEEGQVLRFQMGGLVKLEPKIDDNGFSVAWALTPELA